MMNVLAIGDASPMDSIQKVQDHNDTRGRILDASIILFAKHGLKSASIRDICSMANANIAAVTYYFGGKHELYAEAVKRVFEVTREIKPMPTLADDPAHPDRQLARWIDWYIARQQDPRAVMFMEFIRCEVAAPTEMLQSMVDEAIVPILSELRLLVSAVLPEDVSPSQIDLFCGLVNGPVLARTLLRPIRERIEGYDPELISTEALAAHTRHATFAALAVAGGKVDPARLTED